MEDTKDLTVNLKEKVREVLDVLQIEQERKPLRLVQQFGYLAYVRLFVESQKREKLQPYFPYGGFPMEWTRGDEAMDDQQRIWQLQYQMQYCSSIVEEGHFMEQARAVENVGWLKKLCKLIDWIADQCNWESGIPVLFGTAMEEMIQQIYSMGNSGLFLMPDILTDLLIRLAEEEIPRTTEENSEEKYQVWNPSCRTGAFLAALHRSCPQWTVTGTEAEKEQVLLAQMLRFYHGVSHGKIIWEDPLENKSRELYDLIVTNPPVGELNMELQERFPIVTRKIQLQYLQLVMEHLKQQGLAVVVVNEGMLFKFEAEMKMRQRLVEEFQLEGVISLPAGAFLPYTVSKASVLLFSNPAEKREENACVWFYELENPGYSLDKKREPVEESQLPDLLESWKNRRNTQQEWKKQLTAGTKKNQWENLVPESWIGANCWFADKETIRRNDYNLTAGRYKPWKETREEISQSPLELLTELAKMEQETMEQIKELIEMTKKYG